MSDEKIYLMQPSFTGGEISPEVANRIDLDKYQQALLNAENAYIRPYGAVYKRTGSEYCGQAKDENVLLMEFQAAANEAFLLEVGEKYIRVWKDGVYTGQYVPTPYTWEEVPTLRTCQSADIMYIASGTHPVMKLCHYSDTDWRLEEMTIDKPYFDISLTADAESVVKSFYQSTAGTYSFTPTITGDYTVEVAGAGGGGYWASFFRFSADAGGRGGLIQKTVTLTKDVEYTVIVGAGGTTGGPWDTTGNPTDGGNSSACGITAQGGGAATSEAAGKSYGQGGQGGIKYENKTTREAQDGWVSIGYTGNAKLTPSKTSGRDATVTATKGIFTDDMVGGHIKLIHEMPSRTVSTSGSATSEGVLVGSEWKIITHGTWTGTVKVQTSTDGVVWKDFRSYTSSGDFNASESGTVETSTYFRIVATAGKADLTAMPYTHEGTMAITRKDSSTQITGNVIEDFGSTEATEDYALSAWCPRFGYPRTVGFFQDRLIFGGTTAQPYEVWMSRTGDYENFSVEKVSGTVTDDSAIALAFVSRKQAEIQHLCPGSDLFVLTDSNEWIVSGGSTVTPTKCTNKAQTFRGSSEVPPLSIGGRMIYIQKRSQSVRDFAYTFETDSYDGADLTLLAKHLFRGKQIIDAAYMQDPDSRLYFVRSDGVMLCLAYVQDQKVYAWSHLKTDGQYISVCNIAGATKDEVYVAVKRNTGSGTVTTIERLSDLVETDNPMDYVMVDCAAHTTKEEATDTITVEAFNGKTVTVLADGQYYDNVEMDGSTVTIPAKAHDWIVGLPYTMKLEVPNVEFQDQRGTAQGRTKKLSRVTLRLINSLGGKVGNGVGAYDEIKYDEFSDLETTLYSGDKDVTIPNQSAEKNGRVLIESDAPYPFNLAGIVRGVKSID